MKEHIIQEILKKEWKMFSNVQNEGGKASCQEDHGTFTIMRSSQFESLPIYVLESYFHDLAVAERQNTNLMTEKYARMMEFTDPIGYKATKKFLRKIDVESQKYVEEAILIFLNWEKVLRLEFPYLFSNSRPLFSSEDSPSSTSFETYQRAELYTYSPNTIKLYSNFIKESAKNNINISKQIQLNIVKKYGYNSLQEANEAVKKRIKKSN